MTKNKSISTPLSLIAAPLIKSLLLFIFSPFFTPLFLCAGEQALTSAGSSTWSVPAGVVRVKVTVVGGGGGGGNGAANNVASAGGGGGGYAIRVISGLTPGAAISYTVGAGGAIQASGTASSFGPTNGVRVSATGGGGGGPWGYGSGGTGSGGTLNGTGGDGGGFLGASTTGWVRAGAGGNSLLGGIAGGGHAVNNNCSNAAGQPGKAYGGGGGGGAANSGCAQSGGRGATGVILIEY